MKTDIRTRLIFAILVTVLIPLIGTGLYGNWITSRTLEAQALDNAQADLRLRAEQIEGYLRNVREDILFLSQLGPIEEMLSSEAPSAEALQAIEGEFASFAQSHPGIFQIRLLDHTGMEIVRVENGPDGTIVIPIHELQNKADRYYFQATMRLDPGDVYISRLDLNREGGALQLPQTPTIRYATPLLDTAGSRAGIVILNLYADPFLEFARSDPSGTTLALVDDQGYYLAHPIAAKLWGGPNDLDTGVTGQEDYPDAWGEMAAQSYGVLVPPAKNALVSLLDAILPAGLLQGSGADPLPGIVVYETVEPNGSRGPRWILIRDEPQGSLFASIGAFRVTAIGILVAATIVTLGIAISLSHSLSAPLVTLTKDVDQFVRSRLGQKALQTQQEARPQDEIKALTEVFREMSSTIDQHLDQLTLLNKAGHHIAARLETPAVLEAAVRAAEALIACDYLALQIDGRGVYQAGNAQWEIHRTDPKVQTVLEAAMVNSTWQVLRLDGPDSPDGCLCCAPLCVDGFPGLIELYGTDPVLGEPVTGDIKYWK